MITEWIMSIGVQIATWFSTLFPQDWEPPAFLVDFDNQVNAVISNVDGMAVWADWVYILAVVAIVIIVWGIGLAIKVLRAVAAHLPFVGGAG